MIETEIGIMITVMKTSNDQEMIEDGEILEDGEIADDDDIVPIGTTTSIINNNSNNNNNQNKTAEPTGKYYQNQFFSQRNDEFLMNDHKKQPSQQIQGKRKKRGAGNISKKLRNKHLKSNGGQSYQSLPNNSNKRKSLSQSSPSQEPITQRDTIDITQYLDDSSFDSIELSDVSEYSFDSLEFDVFLQILGLKIQPFKLEKIIQANEKAKFMTRIVKIIKKNHGDDADTARRCARLKRRAKEKKKSSTTSVVPSPTIDLNSKNNANNNANAFKTPCKFYMDGKCYKGKDCTYSHDVPMRKRRELCKFYLQGHCGKENCLFMHQEFPCKFFHTNTICYSGENCRFSHTPLTEETRELLRNYLDSGTFPDEVKPYRPINQVQKNWSKTDQEDQDSNDSEQEVFLKKDRPHLLGEPSRKMRISYETWKWQQDLKEAEKAYTGVKKNLFTIDDGLVIAEQPLIEEDEEEIEAHIRNYYQDIAGTDEYEEMLHVQEIEEHQRFIEDERRQTAALSNQIPPEAVSLPSVSNQPPSSQPLPPTIEEMIIHEEEKRLIEASAHDEDLRMLPFNNTLPPAFQEPPVVPSAGLPPPPPQQVLFGNNNFPAPPSSTGPFHDEVPSVLQLPSDPVIGNFVSQLRHNTSVPAITTANDSSVQSSTNQQALPPRDPRLLVRDPRLTSNRVVTTQINQNVEPCPTVASLSLAIKPLSSQLSPAKPIDSFRVIISNPNLVVPYQLYVVRIDLIDYSSYYESYNNDTGSLKNDPRLKKFFDLNKKSSISNDILKNTESNEPNFFKSSTITPSLNPTAPVSVMIASQQPIQNKIFSSSIKIASTTESETANTTPSFVIASSSSNRDPRKRSKDIEPRAPTNVSDSKTDSVTIVSTPNITFVGTRTETETTNVVSNNSQNLSSIPSYALSALQSTRSMFSSSLLFPNNDLSDDKRDSFNKNMKNVESDVDDDEDDDCLKVDESIVESIEDEVDDSTKDTKNNIKNLDRWSPKENRIETIGSIDSDNEMEIDLSHCNNNESESEYENDLVIATQSSSEPEDNVMCLETKEIRTASNDEKLDNSDHHDHNSVNITELGTKNTNLPPEASLSAI